MSPSPRVQVYLQMTTIPSIEILHTLCVGTLDPFALLVEVYDYHLTAAGLPAVWHYGDPRAGKAGCELQPMLWIVGPCLGWDGILYRDFATGLVKALAQRSMFSGLTTRVDSSSRRNMGSCHVMRFLFKRIQQRRIGFLALSITGLTMYAVFASRHVQDAQQRCLSHLLYAQLLPARHT